MGFQSVEWTRVLRFVRGMLYARTRGLWNFVITERGMGGMYRARSDGVFVKASRAFLLKISLKREKTNSAPCVPLGELKEDAVIMRILCSNQPINVSQLNLSSQSCGYR